jgi:hypothetical protein
LNTQKLIAPGVWLFKNKNKNIFCHCQAFSTIFELKKMLYAAVCVPNQTNFEIFKQFQI